MKPVLIIGVGNEFRRDDGVGLTIARTMAQLKWDGVTVTEQSGEGAALMDAWRQAKNVFVTDAVEAGGVPGEVFRIDGNRETIPAAFFHYSSHAFSVGEAIELARALGTLPPRIILYGVQGADFAAGTGLTEAVNTAAEKVVEQITREIQEA